MTTAAVEVPTYDLFINGEFVPAKSGNRFVRKSPATGQPVGDFARMSEPVRASGTTRVWIGKGALMPRSASA